MAKLGVAIKIDVSKIDKNRLFKGKKGTYLDATVFIDTENPGQYGDHGFIAQSVSKEERESGVKGEILGNVKVFFTGDSEQGQQAGNQSAEYGGSAGQTPDPDFDQDIPF